MCFRVKMFRVESYLLYVFYTWSIWTLTSTAVKCTNMTLDCTKSIVLTSPNYPSLYPNGAFEEWNITAPPNRRILVTFNDFNLEYPYDFIDIRDMYHFKKPYTGENVQFPPYLMSGHTLHIEFISSRSGRRKGFNISVLCNELSNARSGRLMDGASPAEGFLELPTQSGEWKRVCEDSLTESVAEVICGELGYPGFKEISYVNSTCASDQDNCTRAPTCNPSTYRLVDCTAQHSMCSSEKVVKIKCHEPGYKGCYELDKTLQNISKFKFTSTAHCMSLCKTHEILAIAIINQKDCVCSTSSEIQVENEPKCSEETTSLSKMSVYDASVGFCEELNDTIGGSWDSNITWFSSIVHLTCIDGYSLQGNGTLRCVPGSSPLNPVWSDSIPDCTMDATTELDDGSPSTESKSTTNIFEITTEYTATSFSTSTDLGTGHPGQEIIGVWILGPVIVTLVLIIGVYIYLKHRGHCRKRKGGFGQRQGQTDDSLSTPTNNRDRGFPSNSASFPGGSTSPPRPNTNDSSTPISVIASALPDNTPEDSQPTEILRVPPFSRPSDTSNRPFSFLHRNNPRSDNPYVSSTSVTNPCYYASSFDNPRSGDTVRLQEAYQEPSSMDITNHAYEGTTDGEGQSNVTLKDVNLYHYASSSEYPMVASSVATNPEEAYQEPSTMDMADHAYEGTYGDQEQPRTTIEDRFCRGFSMTSRPLPHRPSSANCKEGPTLPPRKSSRGSKNAIHAIASLRQRKCAMHNENNNIFLGACSSDLNVIHDLPKKHATSNNRKGHIETPLYHTLEDNEQPKRRLLHDNQESPPLRRPQGGRLDAVYHCLENDNQESHSGDNHLAYGAPVSTNTQDSTDLTHSVRMIDNILYVPMSPCSK